MHLLHLTSELSGGLDPPCFFEGGDLVLHGAAGEAGRLSDLVRVGWAVLERGDDAVLRVKGGLLCAKLDLMRAEIAGEDPTPLEILLTERVVSLWMLTTLLEVLLASQYSRNTVDGPGRLSPAYLMQQSRILESATRRYLAAIRELAKVRKLRGEGRSG